jgi:5'-methylthioadenosine phosphorylase
MNHRSLAVIGGSGFEKFDDFQILERLEITTPFGPHSQGLKRARVGDSEILFLPRHGEHHEKLPHEVNYRANIYALKKLGAQAVVSFSAAGSLREELKPGDLVIPHQYIDRTKGARAHSFFGDGVVGHVSLADPVCHQMIGQLRAVLPSVPTIENAHFERTYICVEGPTFSTRAESHLYRQWGADLIGMTNFPEYALAREAGLPYLPCCWITDYDCWDPKLPHVTVAGVIDILRQNNRKGFELLQTLAGLGPKLWDGSLAPSGGIRAGLFMPLDAVPSQHQEWVKTLLE